MRAISLVVLLATAAHSQTPAACNPKARWRVYFDRVEVIKLAQMIADMTCKPVAIGPHVEAVTVSIVSPEKVEFSSEEAFKAISVAAELAGVSILDKDGVVRMQLLRTETPPDASASRCGSGRFASAFDHAPLETVMRVVSDLTCKRAELEPGTEKTKITLSKRDFSPTELLQAVTQAAALQGVSITEKDGVLRVATIKK